MGSFFCKEIHKGLAKHAKSGKIKIHGDLAQLGEHFLDVEGVMGSSPLASTICVKKRQTVTSGVFFCSLHPASLSALRVCDLDRNILAF